MSTEPRQEELGLREANSISRVEDYEFEPIQGYPMLRWKGKRPFTSTQYYPAQHKETYGPEVGSWRNKIYWGDNLQVMSHLLRAYRGKVKLIYIDPPFDSKADYKKKITFRGINIINDINTFEEKQYTDIWTNDEYLQFMYERLILLRELLSSDGSIYVHCDNHKVHHLRCILDEIFGASNFLNEIVWKRTGAHNSAKRYGPVHDIILYYSKAEQYIWNQQYLAQEEYIQERYTYTDERGRTFYPVSLIAAGTRRGSTGQVWHNIDVTSKGNHWRYGIEKLEELDTKGDIYWPPGGGGTPRLKMYADQAKGSLAQDWWDDIPPVNSQASERWNYPTQKPVALLERIIRASSNPGDLVLDCFMGSGTLQSVAMRLGRRFLGADINLGAIQISTKRLLTGASELRVAPSLQPTLGLVEPEEEAKEPTILYTGFEVYNVNNYDIFRNPIQAKELLIQALEVNPLPAGSLFDGEKDGRLVKIMPINRIATRQDLNELITGFDYKTFEQRQAEHPNQAVEKVTLVCMGHEPDLAAHLKHQMSPFKLDVEVVDILRDKQDLHFKRDSEAKVVLKDGYLIIEQFYPLNLMNKLSETKEDVGEWRQLVESIMVDWNYDGAVLQPAIIDVPEGNALVSGCYQVPEDAGTIRIKITDLLAESLEVEITHG